MCPAEAGEGVYTARALLSIVDEELKLDYTDECVGIHKRKAMVEEEQLEVLGLTLSPNPVLDRVLVSWSSDNSYHTLELWSLDGRLLQEHTLTTTQQQYELDMETLPAGSYLIKLVGEHEARTLRAVKQ